MNTNDVLMETYKKVNAKNKNNTNNCITKCIDRYINVKHIHVRCAYVYVYIYIHRNIYRYGCTQTAQIQLHIQRHT